MHTVFLILKLKNEIYTPPLCFGGVLVHIFLALHIIFSPPSTIELRNRFNRFNRFITFNKFKNRWERGGSGLKSIKSILASHPTPPALPPYSGAQGQKGLKITKIPDAYGVFDPEIEK